jgi:TonB-linked SusC/RagA family outer membrane protein
MVKFYKLFLSGLMLLLCTTMLWAQERNVSGTVRDESNNPMPGVNVLIKGTTTGTVTDVEGKFTLAVPGNDAVIVFTFVGYASAEIPAGTKSIIDHQMAPDVTTLSELVVTGYTIEKKADIIGSVSVVKASDLLATPSANLTTQLQGRAAGVIVSSSGEPGAAARVRIRGFTSFGNSDPLYVIDGVPTEDPSKINPQDIESVQVLKDATSASIYGSRASNGVVIVTTKKGKSGSMQVSYDGYAGAQVIPASTHPEVLNTNEYMQYLQRTGAPAHPVFGAPGAFSSPDYFVVSNTLKGGFNAGAPEVSPDKYTIQNYSNMYQIMKTSPGTNWFKEISQTGRIQSHQLSAAGGTDKATYSVGFNYFDQEGTFQYTGYKRYLVRTNTAFKINDKIRIGENLQISYDDYLNGGFNNMGENGAWAQAYRMMPYIPVYDIKGGFGGNGVGQSGNGSNPVANLYRARNNKDYSYYTFGNVYAEADLLKNLTFRSSFGIDYRSRFRKQIVRRTYERSENVTSTALDQRWNYSLSWTFTNTLTYNKTFGDHNFKILAGAESVKGHGEGTRIRTSDFDFETDDFVTPGSANLKTPFISNDDTFRNTLASLFGRVDYTYNDKYFVNATFRRDGSSRFGSANRYANFPAFGAGWRISEEGFMESLTWLDDLKVRGGWGQMGSQKNVDASNQYTTFISDAGITDYDISGTNTSVTKGYGQARLGSDSTKWETAEMTNIGFDASVLGGKFDVTFNYFVNNTKDLLVLRQASTLEPVVTQPSINVGAMRNKGFDIMLTNRGNLGGGVSYEASFSFTHYQNKIVKLDVGSNPVFYRNIGARLTQVIRNEAGHPISSFYGYQINGFYDDAAEIAAGPTMPGATVGSWKFKDTDGDGQITDKDRVYLGSPNPKFQLGSNLSLSYKNFDISAFLFWNYGNQLFNANKLFTEMGLFPGSVAKDVLYDGWTEGHRNARLPNLEQGYTSFIRSSVNSNYIESGSYLRAKTIQIGYKLPSSLMDKVKMKKARVYVQGQNLFTVTKYTGTDPDLTLQTSDDSDLFMGVDGGTFPNPRVVLVGLNFTF